MSGCFITLEGVDGSGKSTQLRCLQEHLSELGHDVVCTREPGGSPGAEEIRRLLVEGLPNKWSPETELLLFNAARRDHLDRTILPALTRGAVVLCDRFADSTRAYQGMRDPALRKLVDRLHAEHIAREPDLTIIIDVDPDHAARRVQARNTMDAFANQETRFEAKGSDFQHRLRTIYQQLAEEFSERCQVVDGHGSEEQVFAAIVAAVGERVG